MTAHTPGPWKTPFSWASVGLYHNNREIKTTHGVIAEMVALSKTNISEETLKANARLIAKAPDLLRLVKELLELAESDVDPFSPDPALAETRALLQEIEG